MKQLVLSAAIMSVIAVLLCVDAKAQKHGASPAAATQTSTASPAAAPGGGSGGGGGSSSGSTALPGLSYPRAEWDSMLGYLPLPHVFGMRRYDSLTNHYVSNVVFLCYKLVETQSASTPLTLVPSPFPSKPSKWGQELCSSETSFRSKSLLMGKYVTVVIDMRGISKGVWLRMQILNINVATSPGSSLNASAGTANPTPTLPSMAGVGAIWPYEPHDDRERSFLGNHRVLNIPLLAQIHSSSVRPRSIYFIPWPVQLAADVVPTISVNLIYTPVPTALPYEPHTLYPAGSIVISRRWQDGEVTTNGHYYQALNSGVSGPWSMQHALDKVTQPAPVFEEDDSIVWDSEGAASAPGTGKAWAPCTRYQKGDQIHVGAKYYAADKAGWSSTDGSIFDPGREQIKEPAALCWENMGPYHPLASNAASTWQPGKTYAVGDEVVPPVSNGRYYQAMSAGTTPKSAKWSGASVTGGTFLVGGITWQDMGPLVAPPGISQWTANTAYSQGALITPATVNGFYYKALNSGVSGPSTAPAFPVNPSQTVGENNVLTWMDAGSSALGTQPSVIKAMKQWTPGTAFILGDGIIDRTSGHYYVVIQNGMSGSAPPDFSVPGPSSARLGQIRWIDLGTTPPSSASLGSQPPDQVIPLLNLTYPQTHAIARFELVSGVVWNSLRSSTITPPPTGTTKSYTSTGGSHIIDPILAIQVHPWPLNFDAESPWVPRSAGKSFALLGGISLQSPTDNLYLGGSIELFARNFQVIGGGSFLHETHIEGGTGTCNSTISSGTAECTKVNKGAFVGATFNVSGFLQSINW